MVYGCCQGAREKRRMMKEEEGEGKEGQEKTREDANVSGLSEHDNKF